MNFKKIEEKWQKKWEENKIFKVKESGKKKQKKYYVLEMFPYPSAAGLHMGHIRNYSIGDAIARFKRMQGFNVLYPMGYDAFGLPAENAAIKNKTEPKKYTEKAIAGIKKNQRALGLSYDWSREIATCYPEYYKWNQWFFLQMLKRGLAYKKEAPVNWCPKCETVLANEQVENGKCWRCENTVKIKDMEQWFFRITEYADRLLRGLEKVQWPENVKTIQKNWIGRKEWTDIDYELDGLNKKITVSTTRPDTNFGATFVVIAPEHPLLSKKANVIPKKYRKGVDDYIELAKKKTEEERITESGRKTGAFTGLYCINQLTNKKMPIFVADFVLMSVGTGIVVGVPGHDKRDFEFAQEFDLPVIRVVVGPDGDDSDITKKEQVHEEGGTIVNSGFLNGMDVHKATKKIIKYLEKRRWGKKAIRYHLRDWLISRQRYWGTPIPVIYCVRCGIVPVPEKDLPVVLPENIRFTGHGNPLAKAKNFVETVCPKCGGAGRRETDTMDTFVDSSWYFLRYCSPAEKANAFDKKSVKYWMPVDQYIGGVEHAVMHLIYARFFTMVLKDMGLVDFEEPFQKLFNQGIVYKDGHKMSKSFGNVITQEDISKKYGIDTARLLLLFVASPESQLEWSDKGVVGAHKFLKKLYRIFEDSEVTGRDGELKTADKIMQTKTQSLVKNITECMLEFRFNIAISKLMTFVNELQNYRKDPHKGVLADTVKTLAIVISPFTPHIAEEGWEMLGFNKNGKNFVSLQKWPKPDEKLIDKRLEKMDELIKQTTDDIREVIKLVKKTPEEIRLYVAPEWKHTVYNEILERIGDKEKIIPELMKIPEVRKQGKHAIRFAEVLKKDIGKLKGILTEEEEFRILEEAGSFFEKEFSCEVKVIKALESKSDKAMRAEPGKPGIELI